MATFPVLTLYYTVLTFVGCASYDGNVPLIHFCSIIVIVCYVWNYSHLVHHGM